MLPQVALTLLYVRPECTETFLDLSLSNQQWSNTELCSAMHAHIEHCHQRNDKLAVLQRVLWTAQPRSIRLSPSGSNLPEAAQHQPAARLRQRICSRWGSAEKRSLQDCMMHGRRAYLANVHGTYYKGEQPVLCSIRELCEQPEHGCGSSPLRGTDLPFVASLQLPNSAPLT